MIMKMGTFQKNLLNLLIMKNLYEVNHLCHFKIVLSNHYEIP